MLSAVKMTSDNDGTQRTFLAIAGLLWLGCDNHRLEEKFFEQPLGTRLERLKQYSLEDQYRVFRYGNDVVHPPLTDLADPIAAQGSAAVPVLLDRLKADESDFTVRDTLLIFERMSSSKIYDVKSDSAVLAALTSKVSTVKDQDWRATCVKILDQIRGG
jgi:hypothetical protein